jgi:hypothetical protein
MARPLTPFEVDPEVRRRIRPMRPGDVGDVARLHAAAMGHSLWGQLGEPFLRTIYRALLTHPDFLGFVYVHDGRPRGFIAGTVDGPRMLREVTRSWSGSLALATLRGVVSRPSALRPLLQTFRYFDRSGVDEVADVSAESMFCSFEPDLRGKRVSGLINKVLFDALAAAGHRYVKITTDADNRGAARQLGSWGFEVVGGFDFYDKPMTVWRLDLLRCDRVDHPGRPVV